MIRWGQEPNGAPDESPTVRGVVVAVISPMGEDGNLDLDVFEKHLEYLREAGVHGVFVGGTAGEGPYISADERVQLFRTARGVLGRSVALHAAFLRPDTASVLSDMRDFTKRCSGDAPDYVSAVAPFYYEVSQEELRRHFETIADEAPAPLIVYNIPANTHNPLELGTVRALARHRRIAGIKESSGDFGFFSQGFIQDATTRVRGFAWIQGKDVHDGASFLLGAPALITGLGNVWIEPYIQMYKAAAKGDSGEVLMSQDAINRLSSAVRSTGAGPLSAVKTAAMLRWGSCAYMRLAAMRPPGGVADRIRQAVRTVVEGCEDGSGVARG